MITLILIATAMISTGGFSSTSYLNENMGQCKDNLFIVLGTSITFKLRQKPVKAINNLLD